MVEETIYTIEKKGRATSQRRTRKNKPSKSLEKQGEVWILLDHETKTQWKWDLTFDGRTHHIILLQIMDVRVDVGYTQQFISQ